MLSPGLRGITTFGVPSGFAGGKIVLQRGGFANAEVVRIPKDEQITRSAKTRLMVN